MTPLWKKYKIAQNGLLAWIINTAYYTILLPYTAWILYQDSNFIFFETKGEHLETEVFLA